MSRAQLSRLLPLPDEELQQVLEYASTLSKSEAAEHFHNLVGDSPQAVEFISTFNSRRRDPGQDVEREPAPASGASSNTPSDIDAVPKSHRAPKKKKAPLHTPAPRKVDTLAPAPGAAYYKRDAEDDYISGRSGASTPSNKHFPAINPPPATSAAVPSSKPAPSIGGFLISDLLSPKSKPRSNPTSRSSTPGPGPKTSAGAPTKVAITGGTPMHGASTALSDLDAAIRALELTTNPSLSKKSSSPADVAARRCSCVATRHPLQAAAPNCLNCGKVVCLKEGLGPCTFCGTPLLTGRDAQAMIRELKAERGRERMAADRDAHRRADVASTPRPFTKPRDEGGPVMPPKPGGRVVDIGALEAEARAREHRDRLLAFQSQNVQRTTVRDEAADFDVPSSGGGSMWASPEERAKELKRQQKVLREMEWNARPDYEKRKQVVSIDLVGGKVVRRMMAVDRPASSGEDENEDASMDRPEAAASTSRVSGATGGGAFSRNPLLGGLIKPVYTVKGKGTELEGRKSARTTWRRVQDDVLDDNRAVAVDDSLYGQSVGGVGDGPSGGFGDEPACG